MTVDVPAMWVGILELVIQEEEDDIA